MKLLVASLLCAAAIVFYFILWKNPTSVPATNPPASEQSKSETVKSEEPAKAAELEKAANEAAAAKLAAEKAKLENAAIEAAKAEEARKELKRKELANLRAEAGKVSKALTLSNEKPSEATAFDENDRKNAAELDKKVEDAQNAFNAALKRSREAQSEAKRKAEEIVGTKSTSERTGWRWASDPEGVCYAMSTLPAKRTKPVKYIYKKTSDHDIGTEQMAQDAARAKEELEQAEKRLNSAKQDCKSFAESCKKRLAARLQELQAKANALEMELGPERLAAQVR